MYQSTRVIAYIPARKTLSCFGVITVVLSCATIAVAIKCMMNFNNGLKSHIMGYELSRNLLEDREMELSVIRHQNKYGNVS